MDDLAAHDDLFRGFHCASAASTVSLNAHYQKLPHCLLSWYRRGSTPATASLSCKSWWSGPCPIFFFLSFFPVEFCWALCQVFTVTFPLRSPKSPLLWSTRSQFLLYIELVLLPPPVSFIPYFLISNIFLKRQESMLLAVSISALMGSSGIVLGPAFPFLRVIVLSLFLFGTVYMLFCLYWWNVSWCFRGKATEQFSEVLHPLFPLILGCHQQIFILILHWLVHFQWPGELSEGHPCWLGQREGVRQM